MQNTRKRIHWGLRLLVACAVIGLASAARIIFPDKRADSANARAEVETTTISHDSRWPNLFGPNHDSRIEDHWGQFWNGTVPHPIWRKKVGAGYSSPVVWQDDAIVFQRTGSQEVVECLSVTNGETKWLHSYATQFDCQVEYSDGPYSTPVLDGTCVFTLGAEGWLHALQLSEGKLLWRRNLATDFDAPRGMFPIGTSPLLERNLLIIAIGGRIPGTGIVAIDRTTGSTAWSATNDARGYATPVAATIHGQRHIFVLTHEALVSLDPANGTVRWRVPFRPRNPDTLTATSPVVCGDLVFVSAYQVGAMCLRVLPDGGYQQLWSNRRSLDSQHNNVVALDGCLLGFSARRHALGCVDMQTGEWLWKWKSELDRGCLVYSLPGDVLIFSETGRLAKVKVCRDGWSCAVISEPVLQAPCFSAPAFCGGRLLLRNEQELACFDLGTEYGVQSGVQSTGY